MDIIIALAVFAAAMFVCIFTDISMLYGLCLGFFLFMAVGLKRGFSLAELLRMVWRGLQPAFIVLRILMLIGVITALWRSGGTVAYFIHYGIAAIRPGLFLIVAFLVTGLLSFALGTSFGVAGTMGMIFMSLAKSGGVNEALTAGVLLSAVYVGDRGSPSSSCASLVAAVTGTDLGRNVRDMFKTGALPLLFTFAVYAALSFFNPISGVDPSFAELLASNFSLSHLTLMPALIMLVLPFFKVKIVYAMLLSILAAALNTVFIEGMSPLELVRCAAFGFMPQNAELARIFGGGGLVSMLGTCGIMMLSCTFAGIFKGTLMLLPAERLADRLSLKLGRFPAMVVFSLPLVGLFSNQTIGVLMQNSLFSGAYGQKTEAASRERAMDIENSVVPIAGLIPWSIASAGPLALMGGDISALPFALYLFATPLFYLFTKRIWFPTTVKEEQ